MPSFFFNDTATTEIYTLSLHDALPISGPGKDRVLRRIRDGTAGMARRAAAHEDPVQVDRDDIVVHRHPDLDRLRGGQGERPADQDVGPGGPRRRRHIEAGAAGRSERCGAGDEAIRRLVERAELPPGRGRRVGAYDLVA